MKYRMEMDMNTPITCMIAVGIERAYKVMDEVEKAHNVVLGVAFDPSDHHLWWDADTGPFISASYAGRSARLGLLWTSGSMRASLEKLVS